MNGGSLCTGCLGLDLGLSRSLPLDWRWASETDPAASRIIEREGIPNLGDLFAVDWSSVERVDLLAAGFPCPDYSCAGQREGITGKHGRVWSGIDIAIRALRPTYLVLENVAGIRTAPGLDLDAGESALGVVLADLASLGYVGRWLCLRAADVGAPHRRERLFILATLADAERRGEHPDGRLHRGDESGGDRAGREALSPRQEVACSEDALADRPGTTPYPERERRERSGGRDEGGQAGEGADWWAVVEGSPEAAADADGSRRSRPEHKREAGRSRSTVGNAPPPNSDRRRCEGIGKQEPPRLESSPRRLTDKRPPDGRLDDAPAVEWGVYETAVRRWESILGRSAPRPTDDRGRLAPKFVEWMLGFPEGWTAGEKRTARLRMLGNAVQVQVAEVVGMMLAREFFEERAA